MVLSKKQAPGIFNAAKKAALKIANSIDAAFSDSIQGYIRQLLLF